MRRALPALKELLTDAEPNNRARALWVLDRIGGAGREAVVEQLKSSDAAFRALAVRILRRHGQQYADAILALAGDDSAEVRREVLLAIRNLKGSQADAALAQIAATYDGSDRYQLEAINIAAGDRAKSLASQLEKQGALGPKQFPLLQLLAPERAAGVLLEKLASADIDKAAAKALLQGAVNIPSLDAGWGLLNDLAGSAAAALAARVALAKVLANAESRRLECDGRRCTVRDRHGHAARR